MANLVFLLDLGILILLAMTVFLAFRLNINLKHFRESRFEMEGLVNRLTANVERAEKAIAGLQVAARHSGADIDKKIKESKFLSDELKFMNEAGENLANRLEKLAQTNKEIVEKIEMFGGVGPNPSPVNSDIAAKDSTGFFISDRDYADEDEMDDFDLELDNHAHLQSQAEREFFEVLQKRKAQGGQNQ